MSGSEDGVTEKGYTCCHMYSDRTSGIAEAMGTDGEA
jgi:hypothetical protein